MKEEAVETREWVEREGREWETRIEEGVEERHEGVEERHEMNNENNTTTTNNSHVSLELQRVRMERR